MLFRYQLAENIDSQMLRLGEDLKEIIERMNAASRHNEASADPVRYVKFILLGFFLFIIVIFQQIGKIQRILNAHTETLHWAETSCMTLQRKLDDVGRGLEQQRREQDRSYRFA